MKKPMVKKLAKKGKKDFGKKMDKVTFAEMIKKKKGKK